MLDKKEIDARGELVLAALREFHDLNHDPSVALLSRATGLGVSIVKTRLEIAIKLGLLKKTSSNSEGTKSDVYEFIDKKS